MPSYKISVGIGNLYVFLGRPVLHNHSSHMNPQSLQTTPWIKVRKVWPKGKFYIITSREMNGFWLGKNGIVH